MTYDEKALSWKPHPCPQLHQDQQGAISLCMADTWQRLSGGAGNEPLYHHLWCGQGMQVMWVCEGVELAMLLRSKTNGVDLMLCHNMLMSTASSLPTLCTFLGQMSRADNVRSKVHLFASWNWLSKNTSSCHQHRCNLSRKSHLIYLFLPVNTTTLWRT